MAELGVFAPVEPSTVEYSIIYTYDINISNDYTFVQVCGKIRDDWLRDLIAIPLFQDDFP